MGRPKPAVCPRCETPLQPVKGNPKIGRCPTCRKFRSRNPSLLKRIKSFKF